MKKNFTYLFTASTILLASAAYAQPANDNAANAILLNVDGSTNVYSNVDATAETGEVLPSDDYWLDGDALPYATIWFKFVAPADGKVIITGCDSATFLDSQFGLWTVGDVTDFSTFTFIAGDDDGADYDCVDDNINGYSSYLEFCVTDSLEPGVTYYLQVDGYSSLDAEFPYLASVGEIGLTLKSCSELIIAEIGADNVCEAVELPVDGSIYLYSNEEATAETGEVAPAGGLCTGNFSWCPDDSLVQNSIWFTFLAPASGSVEITTCNAGGTISDTQLAIYSFTDGCNFEFFTSIAANDDVTCSFGNFKSTVYGCGLIPDEVYYLQVDGYNGAIGDIAISATEIPNCNATVQVVHNSADLAAATVDVWANGGTTPLINDFEFRTATSYVAVPGGVDITLTVNLPTSVDSSGSLYSTTVKLNPFSSNLVVAQGLVSTSGYNTSVNAGTGFLLIPVTGVLESWEVATEVAVAVIHGCTDAPTVDVKIAGVSILGVPGPISYNQLYGYAFPSNEDVILDVTTADGLTTVASFEAPLSLFGGQTINVFASGFLDPSTNSDGPAFGLCVATAAGGDLICLDQVVGLIENESISGVSTYPNPANDQLTLNFNLKNNNRVSVEVYDILGNKVLAENFGQLSAGQNKKEIQLGGLAAGLYNMNLLVNGTVLTQKVQVAK
jgi:Secretion system C-terminal sorting domain